MRSGSRTPGQGPDDSEPERAAEVLLRGTTDEVLVSAEIEEALNRSHLAAEDARAAAERGRSEIIEGASAEYRSYVRASARRLEAAVKAEMLTIGLIAFALSYGVMSWQHMTGFRAGSILALLVFAGSRVRPAKTARVVRAEEEARTAGVRWREVLRDNNLLPFLRSWITQEATNDLFSTRLDSRIAPGLIERSEPKRRVATASTREIVRITSSMSAGSLGLSGPRGAGKTTLIKSFCHRGDERPVPAPELGVMVSAPVDYEAKAFILHLFVQLCRKVLASDPVREERSMLRQALRPGRALRLPLGLSMSLLGVVALWETWNAPSGRVPSYHLTLLFGVTALSLCTLGAGLVS